MTSLLVLATLLTVLVTFGNSECPKILSKEDWGGRPPKDPPEAMSMPVPYIVIHHGGTEEYCTTEDKCASLVRAYQNYHMDIHGWNDIGYNFVVGEDGNVYEGRGWESVGAHAPTYNNRSIGICVIGDFTDRIPNEAALTAVKQLIDCGVELQKVQSLYHMIGHRQNKASSTVCPGDDFFKLIKTWPHWTADPQSFRSMDYMTSAASSRIP